MGTGAAAELTLAGSMRRSPKGMPAGLCQIIDEATAAGEDVEPLAIILGYEHDELNWTIKSGGQMLAHTPAQRGEDGLVKLPREVAEQALILMGQLQLLPGNHPSTNLQCRPSRKANGQLRSGGLPPVTAEGENLQQQLEKLLQEIEELPELAVGAGPASASQILGRNLPQAQQGAEQQEAPDGEGNEGEGGQEGPQVSEGFSGSNAGGYPGEVIDQEPDWGEDDFEDEANRDPGMVGGIMVNDLRRIAAAIRADMSNPIGYGDLHPDWLRVVNHHMQPMRDRDNTNLMAAQQAVLAIESDLAHAHEVMPDLDEVLDQMKADISERRKRVRHNELIRERQALLWKYQETSLTALGDEYAMNFEKLIHSGGMATTNLKSVQEGSGKLQLGRAIHAIDRHAQALAEGTIAHGANFKEREQMIRELARIRNSYGAYIAYMLGGKRLDQSGPFEADGQAIAARALESYLSHHGVSKGGWPAELPRTLRHTMGELTARVLEQVRNERPDCSAEEIALTIGSLLTAPFTVLQGPPGSGKTSLIKLVAAGAGIKLHMVSVDPEWVTPAEAIGAVSPLDPRRMDLGPIGSAMVAANAEANSMHLMLLDEVNLASPELYAAALLSSADDGPTKRAVRICSPDRAELLGDSPEAALIKREGGLLPWPANLLVACTANDDESAVQLSQRFLDRSSCITKETELSLDQLLMNAEVVEAGKQAAEPAPPVRPMEAGRLPELPAAPSSEAVDELIRLDHLLRIKRIPAISGGVSGRSGMGAARLAHALESALGRGERGFAQASALRCADLAVASRIIPLLIARSENLNARLGQSSLQQLEQVLVDAGFQESAHRVRLSRG